MRAVSFFNEVDTVKELSSYHWFHFLMRLTQDKGLSSWELFHFLMRLTQSKNYPDILGFIF